MTSVLQKIVNDVRLVDEGDYVILENGIVEVRLSKPQGIVTGIEYASLDNLLEFRNTDINRGFLYMAMDDSKQRLMPSPDDRLPDRCQQLCYPEAVRLLDPENPIMQGEVDDKYQYSCENKINKLHGWISEEAKIGFWVIIPSFEFRNGGISKQNLTSHVGPTTLSTIICSDLSEFGSGNFSSRPAVGGCKATGGVLDLGELIYEPPRDGRTLWEIGTPTRTAYEFFIPDPNPLYMNKLFVNHPERYRQYGLWLQYTENYPNDDLIFTVGKGDSTRDWFFAHPTTWTIIFQLDGILKQGSYKLRIALASANVAHLQVRVNDVSSTLRPVFEVIGLGGDNAIARHGIHGLYHLLSVDIPPHLLEAGENRLYLTQANTQNCLVGLMYDYLRLEEPAVAEPSSVDALLNWPISLSRISNVV
ncbi:hypothetical protein L7F22_054979 [Adiantum nelumboides]|nr:hypothetical protein [Adiantum nelumboides]